MDSPEIARVTLALAMMSETPHATHVLQELCERENAAAGGVSNAFLVTLSTLSATAALNLIAEDKELSDEQRGLLMDAAVETVATVARHVRAALARGDDLECPQCNLRKGEHKPGYAAHLCKFFSNAAESTAKPNPYYPAANGDGEEKV